MISEADIKKCVESLGLQAALRAKFTYRLHPGIQECMVTVGERNGLFCVILDVALTATPQDEKAAQYQGSWVQLLSANFCFRPDFDGDLTDAVWRGFSFALENMKPFGLYEQNQFAAPMV